MNENKYIVVGDSYHSFTNGINVLTVTDFYEGLSKNEIPVSQNSIFYIGQGINNHQKLDLRSEISNRGAARIIDSGEPAACGLTHKITQDNALISNPRVIGNRNHEYELIVNDKVDRLSDHVTGQHIGAMPLMEAARQATISILELTYMYDGSKYGMILNSYNSQFTGFLFPLGATLKTKIVEKDMSSEKKFHVDVFTEVSQNGSVIANICLDVTLVEKRKLDALESKRAKSMIKDALNKNYVQMALGEHEQQLTEIEA